MRILTRNLFTFLTLTIMPTFKEIFDNRLIHSFSFRFLSQDHVRFKISDSFSIRLTKDDLIVSINHILDLLSLSGYSDKLKKGFILEYFHYYELSTYLHGLLQLYFSLTCDYPVEDLYIIRFSHLPHDVLKVEKEIKEIEFTQIADVFGGIYYCSVISGIALAASSLSELKLSVYKRFPNLVKNCSVVFISK